MLRYFAHFNNLLSFDFVILTDSEVFVYFKHSFFFNFEQMKYLNGFLYIKILDHNSIIKEKLCFFGCLSITLKVLNGF